MSTWGPSINYVGSVGGGGTVVYSVLKSWLQILGDLGTKTCHFIRKNMAGNGPLVFRSVLCLNLCQKLVFSKRNE